jgi:hypothetical protein
MICPNPNCKYEGPAEAEHRGSYFVMFLLLCLCILPGVLYALACGGSRYKCPKCGMQIANDN